MSYTAMPLIFSLLPLFHCVQGARSAKAAAQAAASHPCHALPCCQAVHFCPSFSVFKVSDLPKLLHKLQQVQMRPDARTFQQLQYSLVQMLQLKGIFNQLLASSEAAVNEEEDGPLLSWAGTSIAHKVREAKSPNCVVLLVIVLHVTSTYWYRSILNIEHTHWSQAKKAALHFAAGASRLFHKYK
eukprot:1156824-Pelagomonas_calceolata.AAC.1